MHVAHLRGAIGADDVDVLARRPTAAPRSAGTTSTFSSVVTFSVTVTNSPGQSPWSVFWKVPFSLIVPVVRIDGVVDEADAAGFRSGRLPATGRASRPGPGADLAPAWLWRRPAAPAPARRGAHRGLARARVTDERLLRLVAADVAEIAARHREGHVDRRDLVDHDHRRRVVGANEVAVVDARVAPVRPEIGAVMCV